MPYKLTLEFSGAPSRLALETAYNALAQANAAWYLEQWAAGLDPPHSAFEAGVRYDQLSSVSARTAVGAEQVFLAGVASCGPVAAISAGFHQADAMGTIRVGHTEAASMYRVYLEPAEDPRGRTENAWHAVLQTPDGVIDVTAGMRT